MSALVVENRTYWTVPFPEFPIEPVHRAMAIAVRRAFPVLVINAWKRMLTTVNILFLATQDLSLLDWKSILAEAHLSPRERVLRQVNQDLAEFSAMRGIPIEEDNCEESGGMDALMDFLAKKYGPRGFEERKVYKNPPIEHGECSVPEGEPYNEEEEIEMAMSDEEVDRVADRIATKNNQGFTPAWKQTLTICGTVAVFAIGCVGWWTYALYRAEDRAQASADRLEAKLDAQSEEIKKLGLSMNTIGTYLKTKDGQQVPATSTDTH